MIQIQYSVICDNCKNEKEYIKNNHESFIIDFLQQGWFVEKNKHFCSKECKDNFNE